MAVEHNEALAPVRKAVTVPVRPERAFELFTAHVDEWWPLSTHSVAGEDSRGIVFGAGVGERLAETLPDGSESVWGTITVWEPPGRLAYSWHAGQPESLATEVEVTFTEAGPGETRVELVHSGWDRRGDAAADVRASYDEGWNGVIAAFAACT
jgi:uncharacterized protein YndB with AHSA1/START domain